MADSVRIRRVSEQIRGELSQILRDEVGDPRIGLVTVTRVKLASDLGAATIFYSPLGEDPDEARKVELDRAMKAVTSFLRRSLSKRVKLRHTPELRFILDDSIAEGSQTLALIRSLEIQPDGDAANPPAPEHESGSPSANGEDERDDAEAESTS